MQNMNRFFLPAIFFLFSNAIYATPISDTSLVIGKTYSTSGVEDHALVAESHDQGNTWTLAKSIFNYDAGFSASSCSGTGKNSLCVLAGYSKTKNHLALMVSTDNGNSWVEKNILGVSSDEITDLRDVSCFGGWGEEKARCVVSGYSNGFFLAVSEDGGGTWSKSNTPHIAAKKLKNSSSFYGGLSCTGEGSNGICLADQGGKSFISTDGGASWNHFPAQIAYGASCTGNSVSAVCVASHDDGSMGFNHGFYKFNFDVSHDGGKSWAVKEAHVPGTYYYPGSVTHISCSGLGENTICVAVGAIYSKSFILTSKDGGYTWSPTLITEDGNFNDVSCAGEGAATTCVVAGRVERNYSGATYYAPLTYVSHDGGDTWQTKSVPNYISGILNRVTCKGEYTTLCVLEGYEANGNNLKPLLAVSTDRGNTWIRKIIQELDPAISGKLGGG